MLKPQPLPARVLVPGAIHPHALERLQDRLDVVEVTADEARSLPPDLAGSIQAIASILPVDAALMASLPRLEIVAHFGVGYDSVDVTYATAHGIMVTNTPGVLNEDVADVAIALLLNAIREFPRAEAWLRSGRWSADGPFPLSRLSLRNRHVGIFGLGRVGAAVARRLEGFGVRISYHNRRPAEGVAYEYHPSLLGLAENVDTLISVVPSTADTARAIGAEILHALGPDGVLVNIGRGSAVDQDALVAALADGTIAAAGLDVFAHEPDIPAALLALPNAVLLPHVGSATEHTRRAMAALCADNVVAWFTEGRPLTAVPELAGRLRRIPGEGRPA